MVYQKVAIRSDVWRKPPAFGNRNQSAMVRESHQTNHAVLIWLIFVGDNGCPRVSQRRKTENQKCRLVWQRVGDVFGCDRLREAVFMGVAEFSNITKWGGNDKNTTPIIRMFDRYALLCHLNWIKSSWVKPSESLTHWVIQNILLLKNGQMNNYKNFRKYV